MVSIHHENAASIVSAGVNLYVADVLRSHRWYSEVLGLKMELSPDNLSSRYVESHEADDQGLTVFRILPRTNNEGATGNVQLAFSIANLAKAEAMLRAAGVEISRTRSLEAGCALYGVTIRDLDGNGIVLYEL